MPVNDPSILPLEQRPDCPGPELMAAYIDGRRLWWGGRRRLEKHFADCDRCFTLLRDIMDFRDSDAGQEAPAPARRTPPLALRRRPCPPAAGARRALAWLSAGGLGAVAAALLVVFVLRGPADPRLDPLIDALGTQRVTDARLAGFPYGPRPEVLRSSEPAASVPSISLDARGAAARIQEEAGTSTTRGRASRRRGQPLDFRRPRHRDQRPPARRHRRSRQRQLPERSRRRPSHPRPSPAEPARFAGGAEARWTT